MFPRSYFPRSYFPRAYFPITSATTGIVRGVSGSGNNPTTSATVVATLSGVSSLGGFWTVGVTCRNATTTVTSVTDDSTGGPMTWVQVGSYVNGVTNIRTSLWRTPVGGGKSAATTISVTTSVAERDTVVVAQEWLGVAGVGINGSANNNTANPTISLTTQDANNFVVTMFGARGGTVPTTGTGVLDRTLSSEGTSQVSGSIVSNTAITATSITDSETLAAATWTAVALELRSTVAGSYGTAAGTSTATAVGRATVRSLGVAVGTSTVTSGAQSSGSAAGTSTATAEGQSIARALGVAGGTSTAAAIGDISGLSSPAYRLFSELLVEGVAHEILYDWNIKYTTSNRSRFDCRILSATGSYRPLIDQEVLLYFDGDLIFGGFIDNPVEAGALDEGSAPIVTSVSAADFTQLTERRYAEEVIASGTLKSFLLRLIPWLEGVTLDPLQANGPTIPAKVYDAVMIREILDDLTLLSGGWIWEIDMNRVLRMYVPGTFTAPFNITATPPPNKAIGDVTVEITRNGYANNIVVRNATLRGQANDTAAQATHGIWSLVFTAPDTTDQAGMDSLALMILGQTLITQKRVKYVTRSHGLRPGMTQYLDVPRRNLNNTFLITDITVYGTEAGLFYEVTALEGVIYRTGWQETYKQWSSGGGLTVAGGGGSGGAVFARFAYYLGGDGITAVQSPTPTWLPAAGGPAGDGAIQVQVNVVARGTTAGTVIARLRAVESGVGVSARLYDVTAGASVGASSVVTSTSWETVVFGVVLPGGSSHFYELQLLPTVANADVMATAYLE